MSSTPQKQRSQFQIFTRHISRILKCIWLYFPGILFLALAVYASWLVPQGKDLFLAMLEQKSSTFFFMIGMIFWSSVTWYSARLVTNQKIIEHRISSMLYYFFPRLLGFSCFTVIELALLQLPQVNIISSRSALYFLAASIFYYKAFELISDSKKFSLFLTKYFRYRYIIPFSFILLFVPLLIISDEMSYKTKALVVFFTLLVQQHTFAFFVKKRRLILENSSRLVRVGRFVPLLKGEQFIFMLFNSIAFLAVVIYLLSIFNLSFARGISTWPLVLLAFGVLLGFGNLVSLFSVKMRINLHLFFLLLGYIIGHFSEPYEVKLRKDETCSGAVYSSRLNSKEYFTEWLKQREAVLSDSTVKSYPVFLVLSDGGASRAGYWVSSVLGRLQDSSGGTFSKHLLCLSGASGGSFGNGIFYSQLASNKVPGGFLKGAQDYCSNDFLSFALNHMLGPDYFRHIFPVSSMLDRSAALEFSMENPPATNPGFPDLSVPLSKLLPEKTKNRSLPMLFINSTCMQNGNPGVVSTIDISDTAFNDRLDILDELDKVNAAEKNCRYEMKLSNAIVLGARFPYVSPAGKIGRYYFVDGGYFDNSGAGVVHELLSALKRDFSDHPAFKKLAFHVIHITNSAPGMEVEDEVHPLTNDLAAPVKTLAGAYGQQTAINDKRLRNYLLGNFNDAGWTDISLYDSMVDEEEEYSMNWFISGYNLRRMNRRLKEIKEIGEVLRLLKRQERRQFFPAF